MSGSITSFRPKYEEVEAVLYAVREMFSHEQVTVKPIGSFGRRHYAIQSERFNRDNDSKADFGDVDLLVVGAQESNLEAPRRQIGNLFGVTDSGNPRQSGIIGRAQVDIMWATQEQMPGAFLFYVCPTSLQVSLRCLATVRGYKLGPRGLRKQDGSGIIPTINEAWEALGLDPISYTEMIVAESYKLEP